MTRDTVKSRLIIQWEIRSQVPYIIRYAVHRLNVGWRKLKREPVDRHSDTSEEPDSIQKVHVIVRPESSSS